MKPIACSGAVLLLVALSAGCVERRFVIVSDPPGALVYHNGQPLGTAPVDESFVYYGTHEFTLVRDGFETLVVREKISTPWYEYPGLDFFSENLWPFMISDVHRLHYTMQQAGRDNSADVLGHAVELRGRAAQVGPPRPVPVAPAPVPVVVPVPGTPTANPVATPPAGARPAIPPSAAEPFRNPS